MIEKIRQFEEHLYEEEKNISTIEVYIREAKAFTQYLGDSYIDKGVVTNYKRVLQEKYKSVSTLNTKITAVNAFLKFIDMEDCTVKSLKVQTRICPENVLSKEEYNRMTGYALVTGRKKDYLIMRTLALTGCRISELSYFTTQALAEGVYNVWNKGKIREIYLPDKLILEVNKYCIENDINEGVIFQGRKGKPITRSGVYRMMQKLAVATGIPKEKAHPHSLRHLFALTYVDAYNNIGELADILGHSNLEVTRIYLASNRQQKRKRMNELEL